MMRRRGCDTLGGEEQPEGLERDPRESPFELPPVECGPFADGARKAEVFRTVIEQAEHERGATEKLREREPEPEA